MFGRNPTRYISGFTVPVNSEQDEPHLQWHMIDATTATIDRFEVPENNRGRGIGTRAYLEWESRLPNRVTSIELWAKSASAVKFWTKMGYTLKYPALTNEDGDAVVIKRLSRDNG